MAKNLSRRNFLKNAAAGALGLGLANIGFGVAAAEGTDAGAAGIYTAGTYTSTQKTDFATVDVICEFSSTALTKVSYQVKETSDNDFFTVMAAQMDDYCARISESGSVENVDAVTGATLSSKAIRDGVNACRAQALGVAIPAAQAAAVSELNPQDENYTSFESDLSAVLSPIQIGTMSLNNRVAKSAGSSPWGKAPEGGVMPVAWDLYSKMADNGVSLIVLTSKVVSNGGVDADKEFEGTDEEAVAAIGPFIERLHQGGAKVAVQLSFGSPVGDPAVNDISVEDIHAHTARVGKAARLFKLAGGDCVEIKGATNDGINAFMTRRWNHREDEYGPQSLENRARFFCEMIRSVKEACGEDFPVMALMNGVEENDAALGANEGYTTVEETKELAKLLVAAGADAIQVRVAAGGQEITCWAPDCNHAAYKANGMTGYGTQFDYASHFEGMLDGSHSGYGAFIPLAAAIKSAVDVPVGCAAGMDLRLLPDVINQAVADGLVDLVFMNRPLNADPELVAKMAGGRREDVLPCAHCLHCHDSIATGRKVTSSCRVNACIQNAYQDAMPEGFDLPAADSVKNVMVIGGGPAGMEAARIAAQRGHKVSLYEKSQTLGGMLGFAAAVKGSHEHIEDHRAFLIRELEKNGVEVHTGVEADAALVSDVKPDAVIVAVGGKRTVADGAISLDDAFGSEIGENVVILGAGVQAVDYAVYLLAQGKRVTLIHGGKQDEVDKEQSGWFQQFVRAHMFAHGVKAWNGATVGGIDADGVHITTDAGLEKTIACDTVIDSTMTPNRALADELSTSGIEVYAVGDCDAPYNIQRAVLGGNLAARKL